MPLTAHKPIQLPDTEQQKVQHLHRLLRGAAPALISPAGERIELPGPVIEVLREAVGWMSLGQAVKLLPENKMVTTQQAADIMGVSRPFFIKLLESGVMAHHRVGNQRRVSLRDVQEFARKRDEARLAALDRLTQDAFEAGLYERNVFPEGGEE